MNIRPIKFLILAILVWIGPIGLQASKILITETHNESGAQLMDLNWRKVSNILGHTPKIIQHTFLDSLQVLNTADVLIISSAVKEITTTQRNTIHQFIKQGGHVYVQSEFKMDFAGNALFSYLVNKSGGSFAWEGESSFNINPISVPQFISGDSGPSSLNYFWNGTYGCGDDRVFPIFKQNEKHYGFLFVPENTSYGRIMTVSDQDWIKVATEVGQSDRLVMMQNLLSALDQGVPNLVTPNIQISYLQKSMCPEAGFDLDANIDETILSYQVEWLKNGVVQNSLNNETHFEWDDLLNGDLVQARITMLDACNANYIESNIVEIERQYPLSMTNLTILGNQEVCMNTSVTYEAFIPGISNAIQMDYQWKINEVVQSINAPSLTIEAPQEGDIISLSVEFNDGCSMTTVSSDNSVQIEIIGSPIPMISLSQNKDVYCLDELAEITLNGLGSISPTNITWMINGIPIESEELKVELPSLKNNHEVYAMINYEDPCLGLVQLSTPVNSIKVMNPTIKIVDKINAACGLDIGELKLTSEGGMEPYIYEWQQTTVSSNITNMPKGMHTVKVIDAAGCTAEISTSIGEVTPQIVDSVVIAQQACDGDDSALVQLHLNDAFVQDISLLWSNEAGEPLDVDFSEAELEPGNYEVIASLNDECTEVRRFEISSNNLIEDLQTEFAGEAGNPIQLELGLDPLEVLNIVWNGPEGLDCVDCTTPTFLGETSGTYHVDVVSTSGCTFNFNVQVKVRANEKLPYFAPTAFSPNNDANNDLFEFFIDDSIASLDELLIFDRWGNVVHAAKSIEQVEWNGKQNGSLANSGVYIYVAKMTAKNGEKVVGNGSFVLTR